MSFSRGLFTLKVDELKVTLVVFPSNTILPPYPKGALLFSNVLFSNNMSDE